MKTPRSKQTRPSTPDPMPVRFTERLLAEIESVAADFQLSKQDVVRMATAAGLKAMRKLGNDGIPNLLADIIAGDEPESALAKAAKSARKRG